MVISGSGTEIWAQHFCSALKVRWPFLSASALKCLAYHVSQETTWSEKTSEAAAEEFCIETEELCWVGDAIPSEELSPQLSGPCGSDGSLGVRGSILRECWRAAGFPDEIRPRKSTIRALLIWERADP